MPWYRHLLWPIAVLYGLGVFVRNRLFDFGIFKSKEFEVPIICIGNLETGGTGKSPLVHYVVKTLLNEGLNVVVLSRGYGRLTAGFMEVKKSDSSDEVGDEPLQTKMRFPNAKVVVCENRVKGIETILKTWPQSDVIVMDDGFQHRWVKPTLNILVTPSKRPYWLNQILPVGTLREGKSEARRAKALVLSGGKKESNSDFNGQVFESVLDFSELVQINGEKMSISSNDTVILFSGIANSERFEKSASQKHEILGHLKFKDHHRYTKRDLLRLKENYNSFGAAVKAVVTTEKDAARLQNSPIINHLEQTPVFYLPVDVEFHGSDKLEFDKMIIAYGKHA